VADKLVRITSQSLEELSVSGASALVENKTGCTRNFGSRNKRVKNAK
jgi:hypothetical protein